jgi:hypothetical protein
MWDDHFPRRAAQTRASKTIAPSLGAARSHFAFACGALLPALFAGASHAQTDAISRAVVVNFSHQPLSSAASRTVVVDFSRPPLSSAISRALVLRIYCPGDFNEDGGIDGADVEGFFEAWENGDPASDLNEDGGIDGADVEFFFSRWETGC